MKTLNESKLMWRISINMRERERERGRERGREREEGERERRERVVSMIKCSPSVRFYTRGRLRHLSQPKSFISTSQLRGPYNVTPATESFYFIVRNPPPDIKRSS